MSEHEASARSSSQDSSASKPWWVRVCRTLLRVLLWVWGVFVVAIGVGTISNLNTTTIGKIGETGTSLTDVLSKLFIVQLIHTFPFPLFFGFGFLVLLTLLSWIGSRRDDTTSSRPLSEQNRSHMLQRLRLRYEQMLAGSLQGAVQVELGLGERPMAVQNAASLSLRLPDQPEQLLPSQTSIVDAYKRAQEELLILGEPGAGKSTLLLKLAHYLMEQAEQNSTRPLPILLPLSTWAVGRHPLQDWISEQITLLYDVPRGLSQQLVQAELVLPLLDGLDEMEVSARAVCIAAINSYHRDHMLPLVVCSRTDEYDIAAMHERLALHTAVVVQPLSREQVDTHLASLGKPLAALRTALKKNLLVQELASTPLMLEVLMLTYHGRLVRELPQREAELRQQIWADFVKRMVTRKGNRERYPLNQTIVWLDWLARQMQQHSQTIFYLEQLQPDWLPKKQRGFYRWSVGLLFGLVGGLLSGLFLGLVGGLLIGLFLGMMIGLFIGLLFGLNLEIKPVEAFTWSWKGLTFGLFLGLVGGLLFGLLGGLPGGLAANLPFGMLLGLLGGLLFGLSEGQLTDRSMLYPNEGIYRSLKRGLLGGLVGGLLLGLLLGLALGVVDKQIIRLPSGPTARLVGGLFIGLLFGPFIGLDAVIQHYTLRFWLWRTHLLPRQTVPFLEDAAARMLLRRVGGGYSFTHRLLMDYFADLDTGTLQESTTMQTNRALDVDES